MELASQQAITQLFVVIKNREIISDESKVANSYRNFFENAIRSLGIKPNEHCQENYDLKNPVEIAIKKSEQHPSINLVNLIQ